MIMIKIAHECPVSIFSNIQKVTDYDYALVHLFNEIPEYFTLFQKSLEQGREVILDNSIFELGQSFDSDQFAYWIKRLKPTAYIIPDVLENAQATIDSLIMWNEKYSSLPGLKIGVVQGKNYKELVQCYRAVDRFCDIIAISFDYSFYQRLSEDEGDRLINWMEGRQNLIDRLIEDNCINYSKPHHLLGCSLPQEFLHYRDKSRYSFIHSLDTSNPIVHGIHNIRYRYFGLSEKLKIKLFELIANSINEYQLDDIMFNVQKFKKFVNGR